jgi:hypothetical protein
VIEVFAIGTAVLQQEIAPEKIGPDQGAVGQD